MPAGFEQLFGAPATVRARAPGRVNLIGEHTDYNGGYVLPVAIPQHTYVELSARDDETVRAASANVPAPRNQASFVLGAEAKDHTWLDYVRGVTWVLRRAGHSLRGFDLWMRSDVPLGSGLSSSAALEVSLLRGLRELFRLSYDDVQLALLGQRVETDFVGAPVGVMDQMASSLATEHEPLFLDARSLQWRRVSLPASAQLLVISSGVTHQLAGGEYGVRRSQCERAAQLLGVASLRDLSVEDVPRAMELPDPLGRRARHVVTENARVLATVDAMHAGDVRRIGELFAASHRSMKDDYEVSVPEIDTLVALASSERDVFGARLTGGGFGGSIVALCRKGTAREVGARVVRAYGARTQRQAAVLVPAS